MIDTLDSRFIDLPVNKAPLDHVDFDHRTIKFPKVPLSLARRRRPYWPPSGLPTIPKITARNLAMQAAFLGLKNRNYLNYTQGGLRWWWWQHQDLAWRNETPHWMDCSAFYTWCIWNGLHHFHIGDIVNGQRWRGGYTGTLLTHGDRVYGQLMRADAIIYGSGWPGSHVAIYVGGGKVVSNGSEGGPYFLPMNYRSDILSIRRYI